MTSEMTAKHVRQQKAHHAASVIYHFCLIVYLLCQFARALYGANDIIGLHPMTTTLQDIIRIVLLGLCIGKCCFSPRGGFLRLGVMVLSLAASQSSSNYNHVFDFAAFLLLSDLSLEKHTVKTLLPVYALMGLVMIWRTLNGYYFTSGIPFEYVGIVNSIGMSNANSAAGLMAAFLLLIWEAGLKRNRILSLLFLWAGAAVIYRFAYSLSISLLILAFPLLDLLVRQLGKGKARGLLKGACVLPVLFALFSVGMMLWITRGMSSLQIAATDWTAGNFISRFANAAEYFQKTGISLLGTPVDRYTTDNLFLNVLLCHGLLGLALVLGLQSWMVFRLVKNKRYDLLSIQILMLIYAVMETVPMALMFNFALGAAPGIWRADEEAPAASPEEKKQRARLLSKPAFLKTRLVISLLIIVFFSVMAYFFPEVIRLDEHSAPMRDEIFAAAALLSVVWLFPWSLLLQSSSQIFPEIPCHDIAGNGFGWNLAIAMSALILACSAFYWTIAEDWNRIAVATTPVNRVALLPQMDGDMEIRQTLTVEPDLLQGLSLGMTVINGTEAESTGEEDCLHLRLEQEGRVLLEWDKTVSDPAAAELLLAPKEPLSGLVGERVTLVITGRQPVSFWYGNTISAGKFDIRADSSETLTLNGTPLDGQLVLRQSGTHIMNQTQYFWPVAGAVLAGVLILLLTAHRRRQQGKPFFLNLLVDMKNRYRYLLHMLVSRDFHVKYRSSMLGMVWSFLNPMLMTLIYMFVFSTIFQNSIENFTVYVMTGIVLFNYFSDATNLCMQSIVGNGGLITKVYIPKYIFPISKALSAAINLVISMIPLLLIMALTGVSFQKSLLLLPLVLCFLITFTIGVGLILSAALVFFRDVQFLWGIMVTILNFLSPVFYPESIIPVQFITLYHMNPMYQFLYFMRTITLGGVSPQPVTYLYCTVFSLGTLLLGILVFRKNQDRFVLYL